MSCWDECPYQSRSDFTYEDLGDQDAENHEFQWLEIVHYYNKSKEIIKRLEAENFDQITDVFWSPRKMTMYDLLEDRKTELAWQEREINAEIPDWRFTVRGLRRGI